MSIDFKNKSPIIYRITVTKTLSQLENESLVCESNDDCRLYPKDNKHLKSIFNRMFKNRWGLSDERS